jgi:hypothetical protein
VTLSVEAVEKLYISPYQQVTFFDGSKAKDLQP